ncbi:chondroitinase-B domain-containing protein [Pseudalgibacter alginicilyticus]|nr:chondroitinase-B domain-containing protein [Pseudalgibacter alginicilyticus]
MKRKLLNYLSCMALVSIKLIYGQTVTNQSSLNSAISAAVPGTTIILSNNGSWANTTISISKDGTAANPIVIKAESPGMVVFSGNTNVKLGGDYIHFEGVVFENPPNSVSTDTPLIDFRVNSSNVCNNCKVSNIKIDAFNQGSSQQTSVFKWILLRGANNEISYSSFVGKHGVGSIINDNRDSPAVENFHKIHHNYFANRTPQGTSVVNEDNDQDAIRLGNSSTSLSDSSSEVYDNYFYDFVGEIEVISNKSGNNKYYNNTFENYSGALTLRHGNNCEVYNNFFLANGQSFSGGIRVMGENHKIYNNYIEGTRAKYPNNSSTNGLAGINIHNGILNSALNQYYQVKNTTIVNNTFVNCDLGIRVGATFNSSQNQPPQDVIIGNNLFFVDDVTIPSASSNRAIQVTTQLIGSVSKYENNIKQTSYAYDSFGSFDGGGNLNVEVPPIEPALLTSGNDIYNVVYGSAAIDYGEGNYLFLNSDVLGGTRPMGASIDAGAEEFNGGGAKRPYRQSDVGVTVGFGGSPTLNVDNSIKTESILRIYPNPIRGDYLNISLDNQVLGQVQIIDMLGRIISNEIYSSQKETIYVSDLTSGTYILKIKNVSKIFVKQ